MKGPPPHIVILTGLSGSGKSEALDTLEDAGYFAIDNLPGQLLAPLLELFRMPESFKHFHRLALVMDAREKAFLQNFQYYLSLLKSHQIRFHLLFFDARDEVLIRRFSETRRKHPLAPASRISVGIQKERLLMHPIREAATHIVDTSNLNIHELRDKVLDLLKKENLRRELSLSVISFGYRFGLPLDADLVFDVRFLPNPHFVRSLRALPGRHPKVARFVLKQPATRSFLRVLRRLLALLLKQFLKEGKAYVTIAFGCTGGRHRSVAIAERMSRDLNLLGYPVRIVHRDIARGD